MRIILSAAVSVDGHIDDRRAERLILSHPEDMRAVYDLRGKCDAIMVGANTIRRDNPSLGAGDADAPPIKVTMTRSGLLPREANFFQSGDVQKLVYCPKSAAAFLRENLSGLADVVALPDDEFSVRAVVEDLRGRGIRSLMVEGGTSMLTQFLEAGLADELRLAVAPVFVGDNGAPRLVHPAEFPHSPDRRMTLRGVHALGDTAVLHYELERTTV